MEAENKKRQRSEESKKAFTSLSYRKRRGLMGLMAYNSGVLLKLGYLQLPIKYKIVYFDHGNRNK